MNWREAVEPSAASSTASSAASSAVSSAATLFVCAAPHPYSLSTALCPLLFIGCVGSDSAHGVQRHPSSNKCVPTFRCLWSLALEKLIPSNDLRTEPIPPTDPLKTILRTDLWMWCYRVRYRLSSTISPTDLWNTISPAVLWTLASIRHRRQKKKEEIIVNASRASLERRDIIISKNTQHT